MNIVNVKPHIMQKIENISEKYFQKMFGTNGHHYTRDLQILRDGRVKLDHIEDTTNIRMPNGERMEIKRGRMQGTTYDKMRTCRTCNEIKNKKEFCDYSVMERDRRNNSLNIHCRDCQPVKYACGYKQDGFIVGEDQDEEDEDEDEEFEVESITSFRFGKDECEFLVHWLNYGHEHDTWEPFSGLKHLTVLKKYIKMFVLTIE